MRRTFLLLLAASILVNMAIGEQVECIYGKEKRLTAIRLPDGGLIRYSYENARLKQVSRQNRLGEELYSHVYYWDVQGRLASETGWFTTYYSYDSSGRLFSQTNPYLQETLEYDSAGNLIRKGNTIYSYNSYGELTEESDRFHASYDEQYNLVVLNDRPLSVDEHNHLQEYIYNSRGDLLKPGFIYDHAGQLIEAAGEQYFYDSLGVRTQKNNTHFLYLGLEEIGALENGQIKELKIPGITPIAIEIDGKPYAPVIDAQGIIRMLVDPLSGQVVRENHCDSFGSGLDESIPYAYWGKRFDPDTGLIYFGRRYYDPSLRRWLTPDPLGTIDHSNLYQFVYNNPFRYCDPTGAGIWGYLLGWGEIILGGTLIVTGGMLEIATLGGYTIGCGLQCTTGAALIGDGLGRTTVEAFNLSQPQYSYCKSEKEYKKPKPNVSEKEGAKDVPSWAKGEKPYKGESGKDFAQRLLDEKYGQGNYDKGPTTEFNKIQKWGDRSWE